MAELYWSDVLEWSDHQARLLSQLPAGQSANEVLDWSNIIEEVESVGRSQVDADESLLTLAFLQDIKCEAWPGSRDIPHWQAEARLFHKQASRRVTPSIRSRIDVAGLFEDARSGLPDEMDGQPQGKMTSTCPETLEQALDAG